MFAHDYDGVALSKIHWIKWTSQMFKIDKNKFILSENFVTAKYIITNQKKSKVFSKVNRNKIVYFMAIIHTVMFQAFKEETNNNNKKYIYNTKNTKKTYRQKITF